MRQTEKDKDRGRDLVERECEISTCKWQGEMEREKLRKRDRQTNRQTHREKKKGRKRTNRIIYEKKR